jgi:tetratricopeptide (TPR) repeat protein
MKRILFIITFLAGFSALFAQSLTFDGVKRNLEKSDSDIQNDRRNSNPKTWVDRAATYMDAADVNTQFLRLGLPVEELKLFMRNPLSTETIETDEGQREVYNYAKVRVYLQDGAVVDWKETDPVHPDPLPVALEAIKKAYEIDEKGRFEKQILENLSRLNNLLLNKAILAYQEEDYKESFRFFNLSIDLMEMPAMAATPVDTAIYYNTGLVASFAEMPSEALKYYNKAKDMDYGGANIYVLIKDQYIGQNDSASAEKILQEGFSKFPDDNAIVIELINYYITSGKTDAALEYLKIAKELEPSNASLYFAEGFLYERMEDMDQAKASYEKAVEVNPEFFDALYNLGALWYNKAVKELEAANEIMDNKAYNIARDAAMVTLAKAVPYMERAHEVNPLERTTLETLRTLYYRLQMTDKLAGIEKKLEELE